ncbi:MAG TPA: hypothetical protein VFV87_10595, partial [Pirellulaceae bacterium]|nr:hypothetical protein [Pirellulaceae bacterium]
AASQGVPLSGGISMETIADEALLTDRGRLVPLYKAQVTGDISGYSEYSEHAFADQRIRRADDDVHANCHGWVFTGGTRLLRGRGVEMILEDNGYHLVKEPAAGDVIVYRDCMNQIIHTGLVRTALDDGLVLVESKWGIEGRYLHRPEDQYYSKTYQYYRSTREPQEASAQARHLVRAVKVLPGSLDSPNQVPTALADGGPMSSIPPLADVNGIPLPKGETYSVGAE